MAGAHDPIFFGAVENGAGSVRAGAAVGEVGIFGRPQKQAGMQIVGITENFRAANGDFSGVSDHESRIASGAAGGENAGGAGCSGECAKRDELMEAASRNFFFAICRD
jgi:hypothetical protein